MTSPSESNSPSPEPSPVAPLTPAAPATSAPAAEALAKPRGNPFRALARIAVSLVLGLLVGVVLHYLIYRLSLPSKPFIYVAF